MTDGDRKSEGAIERSDGRMELWINKLMKFLMRNDLMFKTEGTLYIPFACDTPSNDSMGIFFFIVFSIEETKIFSP